MKRVGSASSLQADAEPAVGSGPAILVITKLRIANVPALDVGSSVETSPVTPYCKVVLTRGEKVLARFTTGTWGGGRGGQAGSEEHAMCGGRF